ncbi:MAG: BatD family protein [Rickettsiales bacterium]|nr:BatD family protein [Rickettsiales bacterium]
MVKILIFILLIISNNLNAAEFTARTSKEIYNINEEIEIILTLSNTERYHNPDISLLTAAGLKLTSNNINSKTSIINGKYKKEIIWYQKYISDKLGEITIPEISIKSDNEILKTKALTIKISKDKLDAKDSDKNIEITAKLNKQAAHIGETLIYQLKIIRYKDIYNEIISPPSSEQAIIKQIGKEKSYNQIINNKEALISEYFFQITPLEKKLNIEPAIITGKIAEEDQNDPFNNFGNFIRFKNIKSYKNIKKYSEKISLNLKNRPTANIIANNLTVAIKYDKKNEIYVGDPINFQIIIKANNLNAAELPKIEYKNKAEYKIYKEKPELKTNFDDKTKTLNATKIINFTLISNESGKILIPEKEINWFNTQKNKIKTAKIPKLDFDIKSNKQINNYSENEVKKANNIKIIKQDKQITKLLLFISIFLNLLFISKEILKKYKRRVKAIKITNGKFTKIKHAGNNQELYNAVKDYFYKNFHMTKIEGNNLEKFISEKLELEHKKQLINHLQILDKAIYGRRKITLETYKKELKLLLKNIKLKKTTSKSKNNSFKLNP